VTTLVLIPGLASGTQVWAPVAAAVRPGMAVHDADVSRDATIAAMAERILGEVAGELIAVGHSMGGRVAMEMARQAPDRLRGLVLANTGHHPKRDGEEIQRQKMIDLGNADIGRLADEWLPPMLDPARVGDAALMAALKAMVVAAGSAVHERQLRALLTRPNAAAYIAQISCPILLVCARQDGWSPIAQHQDIANLAADAELAIVDNAGHFAPLERPEQVTAAITGWLNRRFGDEHG